MRNLDTHKFKTHEKMHLRVLRELADVVLQHIPSYLKSCGSQVKTSVTEKRRTS